MQFRLKLNTRNNKKKSTEYLYEEDEMGGECGMHGRYEKDTQNFGQKT
jgi:hypothetical protein